MCVPWFDRGWFINHAQPIPFPTVCTGLNNLFNSSSSSIFFFFSNGLLRSSAWNKTRNQSKFRGLASWSDGQVIFSVSKDINYSEQRFAKETFKHLPSDFALICIVIRNWYCIQVYQQLNNKLKLFVLKANQSFLTMK